MKHTRSNDRKTGFFGGLSTLAIAALILMLSVPALASGGLKNQASEGPFEGCKLLGSWLGYSTSTGDAWWMSTASGQNAAGGTLVLEVPGFDVTLPAGSPPVPTFPNAIAGTDLRGTWVRTGSNSFAYTVLGIAVDEYGATQYISKLTGTETLIDECNTMFLENTALQIFLPMMDPFTDSPIIGPIPFPDHYGYRMKVDLP